jgi:hypothetical protein
MPNEELINEARKLERGGAFRRKVLRREPVALHWDRLELECGHVQNSLSLIRRGDDYENCSECLAGWWREQEGNDTR